MRWARHVDSMGERRGLCLWSDNMRKRDHFCFIEHVTEAMTEEMERRKTKQQAQIE
jgi:hypothetical protein